MADKDWEDTKNFETNIDELNPNRFKTGRDILAEDAMSVYLTRDWPGSRLDPRHNSDLWDFTIHRPPIGEIIVWTRETWEVKADWRSAKSGNVFFEYWNNVKGEPSGMKKTEAEWWGHYIPGEKSILVFRVEEMRKHLNESVKNNPTEYKDKKECGDKGNSRGIVVATALIKALPFVTIKENFGF